jgi:hypothetical protein
MTMCASDAYETAIEQRLAVLGTRTPRCPVDDCTETDPFALTDTDPDIVCYEHQNNAAGRPVVEAQHVAGQHNSDVTVPMLGNDHRVADSYKQHDWPVATLRNPHGSPLLKAAATLRGWLDLLRVVIDRAMGWIPVFLEKLDAALTVLHGPQWWVALDLGPLP